MIKAYILTFVLFLFLGFNEINAQTVWTGPKITFTKANYANHTLEANQDRITNKVWITRNSSGGGLFNIVNETNTGNTGDSSSPIPTDTEWAYGTTANYNTLTYQYLNALIGPKFQDIVDGRDMVVHLITDDIYIDIKFTFWQSGDTNGGGFAYERSTEQPLSTDEFELDNFVQLYPNPSNDYIQILGLTENEKYTLYNILGTEINKGVISNNEQIDIRDFTNGLYFLKFENGNTLKFFKK